MVKQQNYLDLQRAASEAMLADRSLLSQTYPIHLKTTPHLFVAFIGETNLYRADKQYSFVQPRTPIRPNTGT